MSRYQRTDYRVAVITGTTGGVTGGDIIPDGFVGVIKHISHSEMVNTGQNVTLQGVPSNTVIDAQRLAASTRWPNDWPAEYSNDAVIGLIKPSDVLQVTTTQGSVVTRVVYIVEEGRI